MAFEILPLACRTADVVTQPTRLVASPEASPTDPHDQVTLGSPGQAPAVNNPLPGNKPGRAGQIYGISTGVGTLAGAGVGYACGGVLGAVIGGVTGAVAGLTTGAFLNTRIGDLKGLDESTGTAGPPPGSDVKMASHPEAVWDADFRAHLDEVTHSTLRPGNSVRIMKDGGTSFPERYRLMEQATKSINLQTLIFHDDETGWKTAHLLARKADEGVQVRVIYDFLSSADSSPEIFAFMREHGVQVHAFRPPADFEWHKDKAQEAIDFIRSQALEFAKEAATADIGDFAEWSVNNADKALDFWIEKHADEWDRLQKYPPLIHQMDYRWHQKILTVDDGTAVLGGMNIGSEYAYGGTTQVDRSKGEHSSSSKWMRDTDVLVRGPVLGDVVSTFDRNWAIVDSATTPPPPSAPAEGTAASARGAASQPGALPQAGASTVSAAPAVSPSPRPAASQGASQISPAPASTTSATGTTADPWAGSDVSARFVSHLPREDRDTNIQSWYLEQISQAKSTVYISNAYFIPDDTMVKALTDAAKRGVDVRILTNSGATSDTDVPLVAQASRSNYRDLLDGGVRVYERVQKGEVLRHMHTKAAVIDGAACTVGSYNLDPRSQALNSECTFCFDDPSLGLQMHHMFAEDLKDSHEMTHADLEQDTVQDRIEQWFFGRVVRKEL